MTRAFALTWRCLLAIALIAGPPVALASPHAADAAPAAQQAMPCHPAETPPVEPPCDDGCCPAPDCDPGMCRIAAPGVFAIVLTLPAPPPAAPPIPVDAAMPATTPDAVQLRPPIA